MKNHNKQMGGERLKYKNNKFDTIFQSKSSYFNNGSLRNIRLLVFSNETTCRLSGMIQILMNGSIYSTHTTCNNFRFQRRKEKLKCEKIISPVSIARIFYDSSHDDIAAMTKQLIANKEYKTNCVLLNRCLLYSIIRNEFLASCLQKIIFFCIRNLFNGI